MSEKCNSCGAEIEYAAGSQSLKCPYCGAINEIQKAEDQLPDVIEKVIPLTVSQDDLEKRVYGYMASGTYTPDDMLEAATFTKQECFYVPAFLFSIDYEATWTASFGFDREEPYTAYRTVTRNNHSHQEAYTAYKKVTDWRPANGVDAGVFSVSTYAGKALRDSALSPNDIVPFTIAKGSITNFNPSFVKGVQAESFVVPETSAFSSLKAEINSNIDRKVQSHGQGDHQKDWHWNAKMSHSTNTLYVPICHAVFDYQGTEYHVWIDGIGESEIRADKLPEDKTKKNLVYLGFIPAGIAVASLMMVWLIWSFSVAFTTAGIISMATTAFYGWLRKKAIISYSKRIRDSLLTQIHASSSAMKEMSNEERDNLTMAFQRPEKSIFAKTHQDKVVIPVVSLLALLGVIIPSYMVSPAHSHSAAPQQQLSQQQLAEESARARRSEEESRQQAVQAARLEAEQKAQAERQQAQLQQQGQPDQQQKTSAELQGQQEFANSKVTIRNSNPSSQAIFNISGSTCNPTLEVKLNPLESRDFNCKDAQHYNFGINTTQRDGQVTHRTASLAAFEVFEVFNDNNGVWNIRLFQQAVPSAQKASQPSMKNQHESANAENEKTDATMLKEANKSLDELLKQ